MSDQATGSTHFILDVNGYFTVKDEMPTAPRLSWSRCGPLPKSS